jgi:alkaline phosphatase D
MPQFRNFNRRMLLLSLASAAATAPIPNALARIVWREGYPFSLGVASGAPRPDGFVIWTRLAPDPLSSDPARPGGLNAGDITVGYEIASDESMRSIVQRGHTSAESFFAHAVHHRVRGLAPGRPYWYRFTSAGVQSPVGKAMTAPLPGAPVAALRLGFVSCSNYEHGYFSAYRHLASEAPDIVAYLGDYIYEYVERRRPTVRTHSDGVEATTLAGYRNRYAQYRLDDDLQRLHAAAPALVTWDDHEVQNDYTDQWSQNFDPPDRFMVRRADAYQAFYEHMPVDPLLSRPSGAWMRIYDTCDFGDLARFYLLDGRQHRSSEACSVPPRGGGHVETVARCAELTNEARSMLGAEQEAWLFHELEQTPARWNILAQDVMMAQLRQIQSDGDTGFWTDDWNGYPASRARVLQHLHDARVSNPVVLTGDIHSFWANDLKLDFADERSPIVASEIVGTSISAPGPDYDQFAAYLRDNLHVKFFDSRKRGYVLADITPETMTSKFQCVSDVTLRDTQLSTLKTAVIENGRPGPQIA